MEKNSCFSWKLAEKSFSEVDNFMIAFTPKCYNFPIVHCLRHSAMQWVGIPPSLPKKTSLWSCFCFPPSGALPLHQHSRVKVWSARKVLVNLESVLKFFPFPTQKFSTNQEETDAQHLDLQSAFQICITPLFWAKLVWKRWPSLCCLFLVLHKM